MRVNGFGATDQVQSGGINYAGGNPCFSETTGQNIPGCDPNAILNAPPAIVPRCATGACGGTPAQQAPLQSALQSLSANSPAQTSIPSWLWWVAGGLALVLFAGSESR
jgi:hypothetical protein